MEFHFMLRHLILCTLLIASSAIGVAADPQQTDPQQADQIKALVLPGEAFLIEGRPAFILWPEESLKKSPQPWVFYAPTLAGYPDSHEKWMHQQFLNAGVAVAGIDVGEAYGSPTSRKLFDTFYQQMTSDKGLAKKPCLLGRSRGGLWVTSWACDHPEQFSGLAGIYPVFDFRTYPGLAKAAPAYEMSPSDLEMNLDKLNPISRMPVLAKAKLPVFIIHGDEDVVVPLKENSATFADTYKQANAEDSVTLVVVKGQGHNFWEGFFRCQELVDFVIRHAKVGAEQ
jgi:pimeloyl-ACP methyl ester carboxylesterase